MVEQKFISLLKFIENKKISTHPHYSRHLNENTTSQNQHNQGAECCSIIFPANYTKKVEVTNKFLLVKKRVEVTNKFLLVKKRVEVTNKFLLVKLHQYLGKFDQK